jgi:prepilin-type N-terminal cleavage/methylation domain-containing protein/prepilin-type processing-associated H-X9-DG protein
MKSARNAVGRVVTGYGPRRGFTLVELLVVIGIIALLLGILLPSLGRARAEGRAIKCAAQLQQIGNGVQIYMSQNRGFINQWRNATSWQNPLNMAQQIDPNHSKAYWGVTYALASGLPKQLFNCPDATDGENGDGKSFHEGSIYTSYAQNCYGGSNGGKRGTNAFRIATFGDADEIALFHRKKNTWEGRNLARMRHSSRTIFAQDGYESVIDGNGDTFNDWYQWVNPDRSGEYLRHNKRANVLFCDSHVERMDRDGLKEERMYTGKGW